MSKIIAMCGLVCTDCPAYIATQKDDDAERARVAEMWGKEFGGQFKIEDINCDGCLSSDRVFGYCNACEIRKCARERNADNCALCEDFACDKISKFFESVPAAKELLESIHSSRGQAEKQASGT